MKHVKMMYLKSCPYCKQAFAMVDELKQLHKEYQDIEIETIEENDEPEKTKGLDGMFLPILSKVKNYLKEYQPKQRLRRF